jgi:O-antigen/teichoic acid export membrane protein
LRLGDRWVISAMLSVAHAGLYAAAWFFADLLGVLVNATQRAYVPQYVKLRGDQTHARYLILVFSGVRWLISSAVLVVAFLAPHAVDSGFGSAYVGVRTLAPIAGLSAFPLSLYMTEIARLYAADQHLRAPKWTTMSALINLGLTAWWVTIFGIAGAAWASIVAYLLLWLGTAWEARDIDANLFSARFHAATVVSVLLACLATATSPNFALSTTFIFASGALVLNTLIWTMATWLDTRNVANTPTTQR